MDDSSFTSPPSSQSSSPSQEHNNITTNNKNNNATMMEAATNNNNNNNNMNDDTHPSGANAHTNSTHTTNPSSSSKYHGNKLFTSLLQSKLNTTNITQNFSKRIATNTNNLASKLNKQVLLSPPHPNLQPHEYTLLLGRGPMGTYLKNICSHKISAGVYVDYLIPYKQSYDSDLVSVGDRVVSVGDTNVSNSNIDEVPSLIARSSRPLLLILSRYSSCAPPSACDMCYASISQIYTYNIPRHIHTFTPLKHYTQNSSEFGKLLQYAFLETVCDSHNRLPFYIQYIRTEDQEYKTNEHVSLMFYLECEGYRSMWGCTPIARRGEAALRVVDKFLRVDVEHMDDAQDLHPILLDMTSVLPGSIVKNILHILETHDIIPRDIFIPAQQHIQRMLAGVHFASFLDSDEGARMRAYLHNTKPALHLPLDQLVSQICVGDASALNYVQYLCLHLIICSDGQSYGGLLYVLRVRRFLVPLTETCRDMLLLDDPDEKALQHYCKHLIQSYQFLYEAFLAPSFGCLTSVRSSAHTESVIAKTQQSFQKIIKRHASDDFIGICKWILDSNCPDMVKQLSDELLYDYAINMYSKFKQHELYKLISEEIQDYRYDSSAAFGGQLDSVPMLKPGCIPRMIRYVDVALPSTFSIHRPANDYVQKSLLPKIINKNESQLTEDDLLLMRNAEVAILFGSSVHGDFQDETSSSSSSSEEGSTHSTIQKKPHRYRSIEIHSMNKGSLLQVMGIPANVEDYAVLLEDDKPLLGEKRVIECSIDGWVATLHEYAIPQSSPEFPNAFLYGASLVMQRVKDAEEFCDSESFISLVEKFPAFEEFLLDFSWSAGAKIGSYLGITLLSSSNTILSMKNTLSKLYFEYSINSPSTGSPINLQPLVNLVGSLSKTDSKDSFFPIIQPLMAEASKQWLDFPIERLQVECELKWGELLCSSLPSAGLILAFVASLLEQKILFVSCRRSALLAAVKTYSNLLSPLDWSHLLVPIAAKGMVGDLLQYPGPFMIGVLSSSDDEFKKELMPDLQPDVTIVDLDAGRVILSEMINVANDNPADLNDLRSQMVLLADELGKVFDLQVSSSSWLVDSPFESQFVQNKKSSKFETISKLLKLFLSQFLMGVSACCLWLKEEFPSDKNEDDHQDFTIIFDEERFFHLKNVLSTNNPNFPLIAPGVDNDNDNDGGTATHDLHLSIDHFDLIIAGILRGQSMSTHITSSLPKESLLYG